MPGLKAPFGTINQTKKKKPITNKSVPDTNVSLGQAMAGYAGLAVLNRVPDVRLTG